MKSFLKTRHALVLDLRDGAIEAFADHEIAGHERARVAFHLHERSAEVQREIGLDDHQQVGPGDAGPPARRTAKSRCPKE